MGVASAIVVDLALSKICTGVAVYLLFKDNGLKLMQKLVAVEPRSNVESVFMVLELYPLCCNNEHAATVRVCTSDHGSSL